jgi:hypothetical protein
VSDERWKSEREYLERSRREATILIGMIVVIAVVFVGFFIVSLHFIIKWW